MIILESTTNCHTKALPPCHTEPLGEVSKSLESKLVILSVAKNLKLYNGV